MEIQLKIKTNHIYLGNLLINKYVLLNENFFKYINYLFINESFLIPSGNGRSKINAGFMGFI